MDVEVDHYIVLGLPSGEEGAGLSDEEINKAYRSKAREVHPDKRLDDPNAHANFLKLQNSYQVLKDENARKLFDHRLRVEREKLHRQGQQDSKRRKMMSDQQDSKRRKMMFEERQRSAVAFVKAQEEKERMCRQLMLEIERIRAKLSNKKPAAPVVLDRSKVLKVSWEKIGVDYTAEQLGEIFGQFGSVENVIIIKRWKKKVSALVEMASKDAAVAAIGNVLGDPSNPLLVVPFQPTSSPAIFSADKDEPDGPILGNPL